MKPTFWTLICAILLLAVPLGHAADRVQPPVPADLHAGHFHNHGPIPETSLLSGLGVHLADFCGTDLSSDAAKAVMKQVLAQRMAGITPLANKNNIIPKIGDRRTFNALAGPVSESNWSPFEFELVDITSEYFLWVEVGELVIGNVGANNVSQLRSAMLDATPSRSINPSQGIIANNNQTFGQPPNVDGDGMIDILMYDIGQGSGTTLGLVSGSDQLIGVSDGTGNERDILYLDSNEGLRNFDTLAVIAAHEYTHLIHFSYGLDNTFISEGMAEYSMVMNGYYWRGIGYISSVSEVSLPLFSWRTNPSNGGPGARDYERGGLFFTYIAEQQGHEIVGEMMRDTEKKGAVGLDSVLALRGSSLSDTILDFHTANHVNDKSVDPRFGYNEPERSSHNTFLTSPPVNGEIEAAGGEAGFSYQFSAQIEAGSVHYLRLSNVADVDFVYDTPDPTGLFKPSKYLRNRGRILLTSPDGTNTIRDIRPGSQNIRLDGNFSSATFILIQDNPNLPVGDRSSIDAFWTPLSLATDTPRDEQLPLSVTISDVWPNPFRSALQVFIGVSQTRPVTVDVVDILGRPVAKVHDGVLPMGAHPFHLNTSDWPPGTFLIRVRTDQSLVTQLVTHLN